MSGGRELLRLQFVDLARGSALGLDGVNKHDVVITQKGLQQKQPPVTCLSHGDVGIREPFTHLCGHTNPHRIITED